jgi:hypothetical protein
MWPGQNKKRRIIFLPGTAALRRQFIYQGAVIFRSHSGLVSSSADMFIHDYLSRDDKRDRSPGAEAGGAEQQKNIT